MKKIIIFMPSVVNVLPFIQQIKWKKKQTNFELLDEVSYSKMNQDYKC